MNEFILLKQAACFQTCLHHTAALFVSCYFKTVFYYCIVYRILVFISCENVKASLYNVVSMYVYGQLINLVSNRLRELCTSFMSKWMNVFQQFLQRPRTMLVHCNSYKIMVNNHQNPIKLNRFCNFD